MIYGKEDTSVFCPIIAGRASSPYCRTNCALRNQYTDQCAIFGIFDQTADVAQRVDELRDVIENGVKVFKVNE